MDTAPHYDLVVRGRLVTPQCIINDGWVAVSNGTILAMGTGPAPDANNTHDAGRYYVIPGVVDGQTHAGSAKGLAGLGPTTRSALAGGVTTIVDMPYDDPDPLNSLSTFSAKLAAIATYAHCDVALYGTIARHGIGELPELVSSGICAVKISAFESHPDRFPRIPANETLDLLESLAGTNIPVGLHNEDQEIVSARIAAHKAAGKTDARWHSASRPLGAELAETAHFLELGAVTGAHVHLVHLSSPRGYQLVERYQREGFRATAELCVHYLHFDAARDTVRLGNRIKVNPPLRDGQLDGLWAEFAKGSMAFVSSDHGSWPLSSKLTQSVFDAGAGIPGLETLLPSFFTDLQGRVISPIETLVDYMCARPARFFGLSRKGVLAIGADADFVVLEETAVRFDATAQHGDLDWSPYDGEIFGVKVASTYLRGRLAFDGTTVMSPPGEGRFVRRGA